VLVAGWIFLSRLAAGRRVYAIGGNELAARFSGIRVERVKLGVYLLSGLAAGIAAMLSIGYYGAATSGDGQGYELNVIAAAVVGGASLTGGRGSALGVVLNGDGRVLTALSRLTPGQLFVRYENGSLELARIGHSDPVRDLALLVPKTARVQKGLLAARDGLGSASSSVVSFSLGANRALSASTQALAGAAELAGHPVLKLSSTPKPNELGGPLLDAQGDAVGIVVSGCAAGTANCSAPPPIDTVTGVSNGIAPSNVRVPGPAERRASE